MFNTGKSIISYAAKKDTDRNALVKSSFVKIIFSLSLIHI